MEPLADLWLSRLAAPAFTVWAPAAFTGAHDLPRTVTRLDYFLVYANATRPLALGVAALVFALPGMVTQPLVLPILRPLEGHGWRGLDPARDRLVARQRGEWLDRLDAATLNRYANVDGL